MRWRRRRRLMYLIALCQAPMGTRADWPRVKAEIQALMDAEFPDD